VHQHQFQGTGRNSSNSSKTCTQVHQHHLQGSSSNSSSLILGVLQEINPHCQWSDSTNSARELPEMAWSWQLTDEVLMRLDSASVDSTGRELHSHFLMHGLWSMVWYEPLVITTNDVAMIQGDSPVKCGCAWEWN
jgi:hypothetical protein